MSERGWLKTVLDAARADVKNWPEWMRQSPEKETPATENIQAPERIEDTLESRSKAADQVRRAGQHS